jgi:hypothetical protein
MNNILDMHKFQAGSFLSIIADANLFVSYSQNGEDRIICGLLANIPPAERGIYVDVGCFHPRQFSNTFFLYYAGWRGVNIDANQASIDLFQRERPFDRNICCALGMEESECDFHLMHPPAASTILKTQIERCEAVGWNLVETRRLPMRTINGLLGETIEVNTQIDLLDIDLEGMDEDILLSLDFGKYRPRVIAAELHYAPLEIVDRPIYQFLLKFGYCLHSVCCGTFIFTDRTRT